MADPYNFQDPRATKRRSVGTPAPFNDFSTPRELASTVPGTPVPFNDFSTPREFGATRNTASAVPSTPTRRVPWEGTVAGLPWKGTIARNVASTVPGTPALRAPVQTKRPAPAAALPGALNTLTGRNGITRRVNVSQDERDAGAAADVRPEFIVAAPNNTTYHQGMTRRSLDQARANTFTTRADAAQAINPLSAQGELQRRLEISQGGFKGSPSARKTMADYYLGQLGAFNTASDRGQAAGNAAALQGAGDEAAANEAFAARRFDADTFNVEADTARRVAENTSTAAARKGLFDLARFQFDVAKDTREAQAAENKIDAEEVAAYMAANPDATYDEATEAVALRRADAGEYVAGTRVGAIGQQRMLRRTAQGVRKGSGIVADILANNMRGALTRRDFNPYAVTSPEQIQVRPTGGVLGLLSGNTVELSAGEGRDAPRRYDTPEGVENFLRLKAADERQKREALQRRSGP